jgi:hypothetical protein
VGFVVDKAALGLSPSTSASPANHSVDCSTLTIVDRYLVGTKPGSPSCDQTLHRLSCLGPSKHWSNVMFRLLTTFFNLQVCENCNNSRFWSFDHQDNHETSELMMLFLNSAI